MFRGDLGPFINMLFSFGKITWATFNARQHDKRLALMLARRCAKSNLECDEVVIKIGEQTLFLIKAE